MPKKKNAAPVPFTDEHLHQITGRPARTRTLMILADPATHGEEHTKLTAAYAVASAHADAEGASAEEITAADEAKAALAKFIEKTPVFVFTFKAIGAAARDALARKNLPSKEDRRNAKALGLPESAATSLAFQCAVIEATLVTLELPTGDITEGITAAQIRGLLEAGSFGSAEWSAIVEASTLVDLADTTVAELGND